MIRGVAGQTITCNLRDATTGAAFTGTVTVYIDGDHTGQAIGSVNGGVCTARGRGEFDYQPTAAETDFAHIAFTFDGLNALGDTIQVDTVTPAIQSALATATGSSSTTVVAIVTDALTEIRIARAGDVVNPDDLDLGVRAFNRILDLWNADRRTVFNETFTDFTFTPLLSPHTIGPNSATFTVTQRPVALAGAEVNLGGSPAVYRGMNIRDDPWYRHLPVPLLTSALPTDVYYSPDWPNGSLYFYPVPTSALKVRLWLRGILTKVAAADAFWLPPGYEMALMLTLAEHLAPAFGQSIAPSTALNATHARELVFSNNDPEPLLSTADAGIPSGTRHTGAAFNWRNRSFS